MIFSLYEFVKDYKDSNNITYNEIGIIWENLYKQLKYNEIIGNIKFINLLEFELINDLEIKDISINFEKERNKLKAEAMRINHQDLYNSI